MNNNFTLLRLLLRALSLVELRLGRLLLHTHLAIVVATRTFGVLRQTITLIEYYVGLLGSC